MLISSTSEDIVNSSLFTGVPGNYLAPSITAAGLDVNNLPDSNPDSMDFEKLQKKQKLGKKFGDLVKG